MSITSFKSSVFQFSHSSTLSSYFLNTVLLIWLYFILIRCFCTLKIPFIFLQSIKSSTYHMNIFIIIIYLICPLDFHHQNRVIKWMLEAWARVMKLYQVWERPALWLIAILKIIAKHLQEIQIPLAQPALWHHHVKRLILVFFRLWFTLCWSYFFHPIKLNPLSDKVLFYELIAHFDYDKFAYTVTFCIPHRG